MPEENKLMERSIPGMKRRERFVEAEHPRTPGQPSGGLSAILQGRRRWRVTRRGQDPSLQGHGDFVARQRRGVSDIHSPYCPMRKGNGQKHLQNDICHGVIRPLPVY